AEPDPRYGRETARNRSRDVSKKRCEDSRFERAPRTTHMPGKLHFTPPVCPCPPFLAGATGRTQREESRGFCSSLRCHAYVNRTRLKARNDCSARAHRAARMRRENKDNPEKGPCVWTSGLLKE